METHGDEMASQNEHRGEVLQMETLSEKIGGENLTLVVEFGARNLVFKTQLGITS